MVSSLSSIFHHNNWFTGSMLETYFTGTVGKERESSFNQDYLCVQFHAVFKDNHRCFQHPHMFAQYRNCTEWLVCSEYINMTMVLV